MCTGHTSSRTRGKYRRNDGSTSIKLISCNELEPKQIFIAARVRGRFCLTRRGKVALRLNLRGRAAIAYVTYSNLTPRLS
jgi:hypothetical protein